MPKYNMEKSEISVFGWSWEAPRSYWAASKTESSSNKGRHKTPYNQIKYFQISSLENFCWESTQTDAVLESKDDASLSILFIKTPTGASKQ